jgi:mannosyltransferase
MHAALTTPDLVRALSDGDAVQGPYYALIHLLSPLVGLGVGMRIPSLLAFAATAAIVAALGLRWWGPVPGLAAGLFFSLNGAALTAGATARPYALMLMLVALAVLAVDAARPGDRWRWAGYSAAALLAVGMHLMSIIALSCIGALALARPRAWVARWALWSLPALAVGAVLAAVGASQRGQIAWLPAPDLRSGVSAMAQVAGVSAYRPVVWDAVGLVVLATAAVAAIAAVVTTAGPSTRRGRLRPLVFAAALTFVAPAAVFVISWLATPVYTARYLSWVSLGSALLVGGAVFAASARVRGWSVIAGLCAAVLAIGAAAVAVEQAVRLPGLYDDLPALRAELERRVTAGDALVVIQQNPHSGVTYAMARVTGDLAWATSVGARLPESAQPIVDFRSITDASPLVLRNPSPPDGREITIWIVSLDPPSATELDEIDRTFECTTESPDAPPTFFGGVRLYDLRCR